LHQNSREFQFKGAAFFLSKNATNLHLKAATDFHSNLPQVLKIAYIFYPMPNCKVTARRKVRNFELFFLLSLCSRIVQWQAN